MAWQLENISLIEHWKKPKMTSLTNRKQTVPCMSVCKQQNKNTHSKYMFISAKFSKASKPRTS